MKKKQVELSYKVKKRALIGRESSRAKRIPAHAGFLASESWFSVAYTETTNLNSCFSTKALKKKKLLFFL